jgi:hypothetical protein
VGADWTAALAAVGPRAIGAAADDELPGLFWFGAVAIVVEDFGVCVFAEAGVVAVEGAVLEGGVGLMELKFWFGDVELVKYPPVCAPCFSVGKPDWL